ncbi:MAG TPA: alpha-glucan family phosphorylase, partial [Candidatus Acidoferrales bacterium]|nr:alpha-glucan family phosphorylase [Candidatus Acidoferrales bacterium]
GRVNPQNHDEDYCMTVLGLKLSRRANAVSALHGEVSRQMWTGLYPGRSEEAVPIGHITNGVHVPSWLAPQMFRLYERHLGPGWHEHSSEAKIWERIEDIDDGELWETHLSLKSELLQFVRRRAVQQAERRSESPEVLRGLGRVLSPDALTIGFARRFATYKRANLLLADIELLASMVNDPKRPVQFVFAGKAHPLDEPGKRVLQQVAQMMRNSVFADKFVFVEDYDINVGRQFVQGVDVWLNNPRRPLEASGTSGMKASCHGCMNFSVMDGWWREGYDGANGFAIGPDSHPNNVEEQDRVDSANLYKALTEEVLPMFFNRDVNGIPREWLRRVRRAMATLVPRFTTARMVKEYTTNYYVKH